MITKKQMVNLKLTA